MFDIGALEFIVLGIAALFIFGPDRLPEFARQAARGLKTVRAMAANARRDFTRELGPEFENLDVRDLNPRRFVRKHLLDDVDEFKSDLKEDLDVGEDLEIDLGGKKGAKARRGTKVKARASTTADGTAVNGSAVATADAESSPATEAKPVDTEDAAEETAPGVAGSADDPQLDATEDGMPDREEATVPAHVALAKEPAPPVDYDAT